MCLPCARSHEGEERLCAELHAEGLCTLVKELEKFAKRNCTSHLHIFKILHQEHVTDYLPPGWSHSGVSFSFAIGRDSQDARKGLVLLGLCC